MGYCLPVISCFFFKNFFKKKVKIIIAIKLPITTENPSLKIGAGEKRPLFDK